MLLIVDAALHAAAACDLAKGRGAAFAQVECLTPATNHSSVPGLSTESKLAAAGTQRCSMLRCRRRKLSRASGCKTLASNFPDLRACVSTGREPRKASGPRHMGWAAAAQNAQALPQHIGVLGARDQGKAPNSTRYQWEAAPGAPRTRDRSS